MIVHHFSSISVILQSQQTFCSDLEASTFESDRAKNRPCSTRKLARRPHGEDRATAAPLETQPDKVDMEGMHDMTLYNVDLKHDSDFLQRAYESAAQMASRDCFLFLHFCTQTEKNVARTVDDPRARRRRSDTHGAKPTCSSTHNAHIVCTNHLPCPGSRQLARPCRSKMRGFPLIGYISDLFHESSALKQFPHIGYAFSR